MARFIFILVTLITNFIFSQTPNDDYIVEYIGLNEGLTNNFVSQIESDSLNLKWIATENGLHKYNGKFFSVYKPGKLYPQLKNENIECLHIDHKQNIWIGTKSGGVAKLNSITNKITNYNNLLVKKNRKGLRIRSIHEDAKGNIWVATFQAGIFILNPQSHKLVKHYKHRSKKIIRVDDQMWVIVGQTLKKFNKNYDLVNDFNLHQTITDIFFDKGRNTIWITTINKDKTATEKILKIDLITEELTEIDTQLKTNYLTCIYVDSKHRVWLGTWGSGMYFSDTKVTTFTQKHLTPNVLSEKVLYNDVVLNIHEDANHIFWISANSGSIIKLTENKGFHHAKPNYKNKLLNIFKIYKKDGLLYLCTGQDGVLYGASLKNLKPLENTKESLVKTIFSVKNYLFVSKTAELSLYKNHELQQSLPIRKATCFLANNTNLWVGSQESGIFKLTQKDGKFVISAHYKTSSNNIKNNRITNIVKDEKNNIYAGSYLGILRYDKESDSFESIANLQKELPSIINTLKWHHNTLWAGTSRGVYEIVNEQVTNIYNQENGLKNDYICDIEFDHKNNLWITTNNNIIQFNATAKTFRNFTKADGLKNTVYNLRTSYFDSIDNIMYHGGIGSITYYNPDNVKESTHTNNIILTELKIGNKKIHPNKKHQGKIILTKDINYTDAIELSDDQRTFTISFISNNFETQKSLSYKYRLLGLTNQWTLLSKTNQVNFMGLPAGQYQLEISASNDSKHWTTPKKIGISIKPPLLLSNTAIALYVLLFICIVITIMYFYIRQQKLHHNLEMATLEKEKEHEINEAKFKFFTNISHEFRTPLTLILGPVKELIDKKNTDIKILEKLIPIEKNTQRLLDLTNQLLDFRKSEQGLLKLNLEQSNVVTFCYEVFLYFKETALAKKIDYTFKTNEDIIPLSFDKNKMEIVLTNLISNALKHTKLGGNIQVSISLKDKFCDIVVSDNGIGIPKSEQSKIFDRYYQINHTNTTQMMGSGIGLSFAKSIVELHKGTISVDSVLREGTNFKIELPYEKIAQNILDYSNEESAIIEDTSQTNQETINLNLTTDKKTILLVDDNREIRDYLRKTLQDTYYIIEAQDGEEGCNIAIEHIPDLILSDVMMPKKDGLTLCKELKNNIATSHIPILLLTARTSNIYEIEGLNIGADDYISKPFDPKVIKARIHSALQNRIKHKDYLLNKIRFEPSVTKDNITNPEEIFIDKAIKLIEENLDNEDFGIQTMVDQLHMSQSTLYRKIKTLTELSLTGFIRSIRLKKAAEIIVTEDLKLSHIAKFVGFNDYKYFRKSFVKQFGCLPSEYKAQFIKKQ